MIETYRHASVSNEFKELERLRSLARHNEAAALANARREEREVWQGVVADRESEIERLRAEIERLCGENG